MSHFPLYYTLHLLSILSQIKNGCTQRAKPLIQPILIYNAKSELLLGQDREPERNRSAYSLYRADNQLLRYSCLCRNPRRPYALPRVFTVPAGFCRQVCDS